MKKNREKIAREYLRGGIGYRELAAKYGVSHSAIAKWVRIFLANKKLREPSVVGFGQVEQKGPTKEILELQKQLKKAELHNKLLEAMLDIGKEQYGVDLRKKPGTKRS